MTMKKNLVEYKTPPLIETVCSVQFEPLAGSIFQLGQFWQEVKDEFSVGKEQPPLMNIIEPEFLTPQFQSLSIQFDQSPRLFMTTTDQIFALQVQRDRFILNWRRTSDEATYPRFVAIYPKFEGLFGKFRRFVEAQDLGSVVQNQFELTYVNIIDQKNGLEKTTSDKLFVDHMRDTKMAERFLPSPESLNWQSSFPLEDKMGRLHINASSAFLTQDPSRGQVMRVDLTARGIGKDRTDAGRIGWFDVAHKWVVLGFADIIRLDIQQECWGRK